MPVGCDRMTATIEHVGQRGFALADHPLDASLPIQKPKQPQPSPAQDSAAQDFMRSLGASITGNMALSNLLENSHEDHRISCTDCPVSSRPRCSSGQRGVSNDVRRVIEGVFVTRIGDAVRVRGELRHPLAPQFARATPRSA